MLATVSKVAFGAKQNLTFTFFKSSDYGFGQLISRMARKVLQLLVDAVLHRTMPIWGMFASSDVKLHNCTMPGHLLSGPESRARSFTKF